MGAFYLPILLALCATQEDPPWSRTERSEWKGKRSTLEIHVRTPDGAAGSAEVLIYPVSSEGVEILKSVKFPAKPWDDLPWQELIAPYGQYGRFLTLLTTAVPYKPPLYAGGTSIDLPGDVRLALLTISAADCAPETWLIRTAEKPSRHEIDVNLQRGGRVILRLPGESPPEQVEIYAGAPVLSEADGRAFMASMELPAVEELAEAAQGREPGGGRLKRYVYSDALEVRTGRARLRGIAKAYLLDRHGACIETDFSIFDELWEHRESVDSLLRDRMGESHSNPLREYLLARAADIRDPALRQFLGLSR